MNKVGRKPNRDLECVAVGDRFEATDKELKFKDQFRHHYSKRLGGKFVCEVEDGKLFFKRIS